MRREFVRAISIALFVLALPGCAPSRAQLRAARMDRSTCQVQSVRLSSLRVEVKDDVAVNPDALWGGELAQGVGRKIRNPGLLPTYIGRFVDDQLEFGAILKRRSSPIKNGKVSFLLWLFTEEFVYSKACSKREVAIGVAGLLRKMEIEEYNAQQRRR